MVTTGTKLFLIDSEYTFTVGSFKIETVNGHCEALIEAIDDNGDSNWRPISMFHEMIRDGLLFTEDERELAYKLKEIRAKQAQEPVNPFDC